MQLRHHRGHEGLCKWPSRATDNFLTLFTAFEPGACSRDFLLTHSMRAPIASGTMQSRRLNRGTVRRVF